MIQHNQNVERSKALRAQLLEAQNSLSQLNEDLTDDITRVSTGLAASDFFMFALYFFILLHVWPDHLGHYCSLLFPPSITPFSRSQTQIFEPTRQPSTDFNLALYVAFETTEIQDAIRCQPRR